MPIMIGMARVDKPVELVVYVQGGQGGFKVASNSVQVAGHPNEVDRPSTKRESTSVTTLRPRIALSHSPGIPDTPKPALLGSLPFH